MSLIQFLLRLYKHILSSCYHTTHHPSTSLSSLSLYTTLTMVLNSAGDDVVPPSLTDASLNVPTRRSVGLSGLRGGGGAIMNNPMIRSVSGVQIPRPVMSAAVASRSPASEFTPGYHMGMASNIVDVRQVQVTVGRFEAPAVPPAVLQLLTANNAYGEQPLSSAHGHQHNGHSDIEGHHDRGVESTNFFKRKYEELLNNCYNQNVQLMQSLSTLYENPAIQTRAGPVSITPKPPLLTPATRDPHNYGYNSTFSHASMKTQEVVNVPRESQNSWINNGVPRTSHSTQAHNVVLKDFSISSMIHNNTHNIDFQSSSIYADQQQMNNAAGDISTSSQTFVPPQSELNLRYPLLNFSGLDDKKELEVLRMIPIIQKELQNSDVSHLRRIVLPKKDAETLLPQLSEREGLTLYMEDVVFPIIWKFKYRYVLFTGAAATKKADPKAQALKAAKAVKSGASTLKKKAKKIRTSVTFHRPKTLKKDRNPKYPRISAPPRNKLDHYQILKFPLTTESAMKKIEDNNTLVFIVDIRADKKKIKAAVKKMYDIQAKKVNTLIRPDGTKKAYVRLTPDYDALDVANKIGII
ncbi:60S ribosomal protein L23A [Acorus gramineus]|uniref:60S ribosomal protein L23A n=1 Tax=Acorus gramineus TaxID=55184 RepID=A0AAV8ZZY5_ACOGR|nr:60S ribosomal protein L23A [Acorus gramineus]